MNCLVDDSRYFMIEIIRFIFFPSWHRIFRKLLKERTPVEGTDMID
jgi:hypothetical protein